MNISQKKKKIVLFFLVLFSVFFILFGIVNTSFFQKKIFKYFSKNIQEKYSISIDSKDFYYDIFSNKIYFNFLVLDHYKNPMINFPEISIRLKNNIIFSQSDFIVQNIDIKNVEFDIKKYQKDSISNLEIFLNNISHTNSSKIDSVFIEDVNFSISEINIQNEIDSLFLKDLILDFNDFSFSKKDGLKINNISFEKGQSSIISSFNKNHNTDLNQKKWFFNIIESNINIDDFFASSSMKDKFFSFSGLISAESSEENSELIFIEDVKLNYSKSFLDGIIIYDKSQKKWSLDIKNSFINNKDISSLFFDVKKTIPSSLLDLGDITYIGTCSKKNNNFTIQADIDSKYGFSHFNLSFLLEDTLVNSSYEGWISVKDFHLGDYLKNKNLGIVNFSTNIQGFGLGKDNFFASINLKEGDIYFNKYTYKNISLFGDFSTDFFKGDFLIDDKNCKIQFSGLLDFSKNKPIIDFSTNFSQVNFKKLNFPIAQSVKKFSGKFLANFSGHSLDDFKGSFEVKNMSYFRGKKYNLKDLSLDFNNTETQKSVILKSNVGNGSLLGNFNFFDLKKDFKEIFVSFLKNKNININNNYSLDLNLDLEKTSFFTDFFLKDFSLGHCLLNIKKKEFNNNLFIDGQFTKVEFEKNIFDNIKLIFKVENENNLNFSLLLKKFKNQKNNLLVDSIIFNSYSVDKKINYDFSLAQINHNPFLNASFSGEISKGDENKISFFSSAINFPGYSWEIVPNSSMVISDMKNIDFLNFSLKSENQIVHISGGTSNLLKLYFDFENVDLEIVNYFRKKDASKLSGLIDGTFWYSSVKKPLGGYLKISDFSMNDIVLGELILNAQSNEKRKYLALNGYVKPINKPKSVDITGTLSLDSKKNMNIFLDFHGQDCKLLDPLVNSVSKIKGEIYGKANFYGPHDNYFVDGELLIKNFSFKVPYLNTSYYLNNDYKILCKKDQIILDTVDFYDKRYNTSGKFSGKSTHSHAFKKMYYNLHIESENLYCLNTKINDNNIYYGDVFASGKILINGSPDNVFFDINAQSKKGTKFNIPLTSATEVLENNNLKLFNSNKVNSSNLEEEVTINNNQNGFKMDFNLALKPNAEVQIIYDEKIGDIIRGSGEGDLKLEIKENGNFYMYGEVLINEGEYLYTMQNLLNKNFKIQNGGSLYWNGNPYDISIDFITQYELKTSLNLLDDDYNPSTKIPVFCKMHMTEKLLSPTVEFLIDIPSASDLALTKLYQLTDSEEKKLQQFLFLLGANSFLIPESTENYLNSGLTTTGTELLSNQISNWLSQITDDFDLGFRWTPGSTDSLTTDEIQFALSMKLLNDKLTINGNASNPSTPQAQDNTDIVRELDVQYELTNNLKLKAFSRTDEYDPISGEEFRYEQGVSIFFEKEFDSFLDLFKKKNKKKK